jgi:dihydropyrimidine dehydrogenase (NAD+) subunit PreA
MSKTAIGKKAPADLSVDFLGMRLINPFLLASAPPTRTAEMIKRGFEAGWAGAVTKTITVEPTSDLRPRLIALRHGEYNIGLENIELISRQSVTEWQSEIASLKSAFPDRIIWGSISTAPEKRGWQDLASAIQEAGPDALELNVSCPHGLPTKGMGAFIGQNAELTGQVVAWVKEVARIPVIVKLTPNVTDIAHIALVAKENGADGFCAINTVSVLKGIDINDLAPLPTVEGQSTFGGYSGPAVKPIALRCVAQIAKATGLPVCGMGGINSWDDVIEFMAVGAGTVQIGTTVMWSGFGIIEHLTEGLRFYLKKKKLRSLKPILGAALPKIVEFPELSMDYRLIPKVDDTCDGCLKCVIACNDGGFQAITGIKDKYITIDESKCDGCGLCAMVCPKHSIHMVVPEKEPGSVSYGPQKP